MRVTRTCNRQRYKLKEKRREDDSADNELCVLRVRALEHVIDKIQIKIKRQEDYSALTELHV